MANDETPPQKQCYEKPTATKITREQAKLKLMGYAMMGDEQAKELLDILFQQEHPPQQKQQYEKPTATELTREQTRLKLMGQAMMGSKEAKELLDTLLETWKLNDKGAEHKKSA